MTGFSPPKVAPRLRLFCLPFAGGGGWTYEPWKKALKPVADVYPVDYPGRGRAYGQRAASSVSELVELLLAKLSTDFEPPFAFFGHSLGALIALELARMLAKKGFAKPEALFVSACAPPQIREARAKVSAKLADGDLLEILDGLRGPSLKIEDAELRAMSLDLFRTDLTLLESYSYASGAVLDCPIVAMGGLEDEDVSRADLEAWGMLTSSEHKVRTLPGGHLFLLSHEAQIFNALAEDLSSISRARRSLE